MFKIESYVTPLILSYVEKYIKNLKPEDSEVSLWGGEAVFHNLDLRLDVLEAELQLPFNFTSGHIHELKILVPWTKLASEPIIITINTIECTFKLRGDDASDTSSQSSYRTKKTRKPSKNENAVAPGYVQSLVQRMVSNINIVCNNVILKYLEDDIVLSLNARTLSWSSANSQWEPAFTELTLPQLILRKILNVSDITVCLDQRSPSGKILCYQEPLLYRCTLQMRACLFYASMSAQQASAVRMHFFCSQLHFSVSDVQLPMCSRLIELAWGLYKGEIGMPKQESKGPEEDNLLEEGSDTGWLGWAWDKVPSILPVYWEEEDANQIVMPSLPVGGKVLEFGFYIDRATFTFKTSEKVGISFNHTPKYRFHPFLVASLQGMFVNGKVGGVEWVCVKGGISHLRVETQGNCPCGKAGALANQLCMLQGLDGQAYKTGSAFDEEAGEVIMNYDFNWEEHIATLTESAMLEVTAAMGFDYLYQVDLPEDFGTEQMSQLGSELEYSNLSERALMRCVVGPLQLRLHANFLHRLYAITGAILHLYPAYPVRQRPVRRPSEDNLHQLSVPPMRTYQIAVLRPLVFISSLFHGLESSNSSVIQMGCTCIDIQHTVPMYPRRASEGSHIASTFAYSTVSVKAQDVIADWVEENGRTTWLEPTNFSFGSKHLLCPDLWPSTGQILDEYRFHFDDVKLYMNPAEIILLQNVPSVFYASAEDCYLKTAFEDATRVHPRLRGRVQDLTFACSHTRSSVLYQLKARTADICSSKLIFHSPENSLEESLPVVASDTDYFLELSFLNSTTHASALHCKLKSFSLSYDEDIINFLRYVPEWTVNAAVPVTPADHSASPLTVQNDSCQSVIDSSLDYRTLISKMPETPRSVPAKPVPWHERLVHLEYVQVYLDLHAGTVYFPFEEKQQVVVFVLPQVSLNSPHKVDLEIIESQLPLSDKTSHSPYAIRLSQLSCFTKSLSGPLKHVLLSPTNLECTLAWSPLEKSSEEDKDFGLGIHIDMNPIQVSLKPDQTELLLKVFNMVITACEELPQSSSSEATSYEQGNAFKLRENFSIFLQWTLPKFVLALYSRNGTSELVLDAEDIVTSIDFQPVYAKLKSKVTHLSVMHYNLRENGWTLDERALGIVVSSSDDITRDLQPLIVENTPDAAEEIGEGTGTSFKSSGAISLTVTRAWNVSVQQKLGSVNFVEKEMTPNTNSTNEGRYLNEIDVTFEPLDVVLTPEVIELLRDASQPFKQQRKTDTTAAEKMPLSNVSLPLFFLNAKPLRLFCLSNTAPHHDFVLLEIESINLVPHNENPISRPNIVRPDLYENALEAGILFTPGSEVEDRQYCCTLRNATLSTGTWANIRDSIQCLHHKKAHLRTMSENPALEWNAMETSSLSQLSVVLSPLVTKTSLNCVFAPAIVQKNLLVAGITYETHVAAPASIWLCPEQWILLQSLEREFTLSSEPLSAAAPEQLDRASVVPTHTLITASKINFFTYEHKLAKYAPLTHAWVFLPHLIWDSRSKTENKFEVDIFDAGLRTASEEIYYDNLSSWNQELHKRYNLSWLETKPGERDPQTGFPPSAFHLNIDSNDCGSLKVNSGRPIRCYVDIQRFEQVLGLLAKFPLLERHASQVKDAANDSNGFEASVRDNRQSKTDINVDGKLRGEISHTGSYGKYELNTTQIVLVWPNEGQDLTLSVAKVQCALKYQDVIAADGVVTADSFMASMIHHGKILMCLDPVSLRLEGRVTWPVWSLEPHIQMAAQCDRIRFHIEPEHVLAYETLGESIAELQRLHSWKNGESVANPSKTVSPSASNAQSYQDDLRTGAFQFVLPSGDGKSSQPLPYQVMFSDYPPAMTWCYPHPRTLVLLHVAPIPFVVPASSSGKPDKVICHLQYWDLWRFETLVTFQLSESTSYRCRVPSACAALWRVIMHFEDEDTIAITPPALAAALRIDSRFEPELIPRFQLWLQLAQLEAQLHNVLEPEKLDLPVELHARKGKFTWDESTPTRHSFATVGLQKCDLILRASEDSLDVKLNCGTAIRVLDYATLEEYPVLECRELQTQLSTKNQSPKIHISFSATKPLLLGVSQTTYHTLSQSAQLWTSALNGGRFSNSLVHYLLVNETGTCLRLGQVDTGESILLKPNQVHPYAWRSGSKAKELQVCNENGKWKWSDPFSIDQCGTVAKAIKNHPTASKVLVHVKSLNPIQNLVVFQGCVHFFSTLKETLEVRVIPTASVATESADILGDSRVTVSPDSGPVSTLASVKRIQGFRIRIPGHAWSGMVPLHSKKSAVIVKIPLPGSIDDSLNLWTHLIRQEGKDYSRLLLLLTPLYVVQSFLPQPIRLHIRTPGKSVGLCQQLTGKAIVDTLAASSSLEQSHQLTLQLSPDLPESSPPVALAWNTATQLLGQNGGPGAELGIDEVVEQIRQMENPWPELKENEGIIQAQPKTDVQVSFRILSPRCQTVCVQVKPWALLVNETNLQIFLKPSSSNQQEAFASSLEPNSIMAPPPLKSTFQIGVSVGEKMFFSPPLQLEVEAPSHGFRPKLTGTIPLEGHALIPVWCSKKVYTLVVVSGVKDSIRWLRIQPAIRFFNRIGSGLKVRCTLRDKPTAEDLESVCEGEELLLHSFSATLYEEWAELPFSLAFATPCGAFSPPITLTDALSKRTLILPLCPGHKSQTAKTPLDQGVDIDSGLGTTVASCSGDGLQIADEANAEMVSEHPIRALPVTVTWQKKQGQWFVFMEKEDNPPLVIDNRSQYRLWAGQASDTEIGQAVGPVTCIEPYSVAFQCIDALDQAFPDLVPQPPIRLLFSAAEPPVWSGPLHPVLDYNQLMTIPNGGEMEIVFTRTGRVNQRLVTIKPANRLQIAARDIRQRIGESLLSSNVVSSMTAKKSDVVEISKLPVMTSMLTIRDSGQSCQIFHEKANQLWKPNDGSTESKKLVEVSATLGEISLLFIDKRKASSKTREMLHMIASDACILVNWGQSTDLHLSLRDLRLENQLFHDPELSFDFPVVFVPQGESQTVKLFLRIGKGGLETVEIKLQPLALFLEDVFWYQVQEYVASFPMGRNSSEDEKKNIPVEVWNNHLSYKYPLQLEELKIEPLSLQLSLRSHSKLYIALDHSPLTFGALVRDHIHSTAYKLGQSLALHYLAGALFKAGWVLGSLELLGSPTVLARTVGSGIRDLILLPYQGIFKGPRGFVAGILNGSTSLLAHVSGGTLISMTQFASSLARNLDRLSCDADYQTRTEQMRRIRPQGLGEGLAQGLTAFGMSLLGGIGGLAHHPLTAVMEEGYSTVGVAKGVAKGLVGVVTKPVGGAADLVAHTGHGLLSRTRFSQLSHPTQSSKNSLSASRLFGSTLSSPSLAWWTWKGGVEYGNLSNLPTNNSPSRPSLVSCVSATRMDSRGKYQPVSLALTPQLLCVLNGDTGDCEMLLEVEEVLLWPDPEDNGLLHIRPKNKPTQAAVERKEDDPPTSYDPNRIAEFVRQVAQYWSASPDLPPTTTEFGPTPQPQSQQAIVSFSLSPDLRSSFVADFLVCHRHRNHSGFPVLP